MEVMPGDVQKTDFFKEKKENGKERQKIIPSRWASKENFKDSRAKIAERKVLNISKKEEQINKQKDAGKQPTSKKDKESIRISSRQDSIIQNSLFPSQRPIQSEEDTLMSSKSLHKQIRSSQQLKGIYVNRTSGFHITKPTPKRSAIFNPSLPSITTPHNNQSSSVSFCSTKEANIVEFGIFSARKDTKAFLNNFRSVIEQQFSTGIDLDNIFDLNRLEYHLLHQIRKNRR